MNNFGTHRNNNPNMNRFHDQNMHQNNLVNGYQNFKKNNMPFQNNSLLNNNPMFHNAMNTNMRNKLTEQMEIIRKMEEMKRLNKVNDINKIFDKSALTKMIIQPLEIVKPNQKDTDIIVSNYKDVGITYKDRTYLETELWKKRTNQPYKNILKDQDYSKDFKKNRDLIVCNLRDVDKIHLMEEFQELKGMLEKHDEELKVVYSTSKQASYKEKFKYNNKSKFRIQYDPNDFKKLKKNKIEYYKKEQQKLEKDKKKLEEILEYVMNTDLVDKDDKTKLDSSNIKNESIKTKIKQKDDSSNIKDEPIKIKQKDDEVKTIKKPKTIKVKSVSKNSVVKKSANDTNNNTKIIDNTNGDINDDVMNMYKNRQKK